MRAIGGLAARRVVPWALMREAPLPSHQASPIPTSGQSMYSCPSMKEQEQISTVTLFPRVLYLTADTDLIRRQLETGRSISWDPERPRMEAISTDEITPGWVCFHQDETLGDYAYVGLRDGCVSPGQIRRFGASVVVSGASKGCGSSREASPFAEMAAGVRLVIADSFEKIYRQNALNIGLLTSTDMGLVPRVLAGEAIPMEELARGLDPISRAIVLRGDLATYNVARLSGRLSLPDIDARSRPMTLIEKIIASRAVTDAKDDRVGVTAVAPGDSLFVRCDVRFSHEYVTAMASSIFEQGFGPSTKVVEPSSCYLFRDHLTFLHEVMSRDQKEMGLLEKAEGLARTQQDFAYRMGIRLFGEVEDGGSEAICHNAILERIGLPGQVIVGTDSHTSTVGALGALGFGVGSTDMAAAWYTRDVRLRVPETVRVRLLGSMPPCVTAKDVILHLMTEPHILEGGAVGKVLEFSGPGLAGLSVDERATLCNMAVEAGAFTGIMEADDVVSRWLADQRLEARSPVERWCSDEDAVFAKEIVVDLGKIEPMVATPGSPRNAVPLSRLQSIEYRPIRVDIAYGGSCTGGKMEDMDMYAAVLGSALRRGERVASWVDLYIQFGSQRVKRQARERGYLEIFEAAGAKLLDPACGACIGAGPGVSFSPETVSISAINRNFPGRSGPGRVYLASPLVVAASALKGYIVAPEPDDARLEPRCEEPLHQRREDGG